MYETYLEPHPGIDNLIQGSREYLNSVSGRTIWRVEVGCEPTYHYRPIGRH